MYQQEVSVKLVVPWLSTKKELKKSKSQQEHGLKTYNRLVMDDTMYVLLY